METARCKAFLTAAETGSFTKAAQALQYTPSGISQLVSALEADLGFALFRRNKTGVTLTDNGQRLLPLIRDFLNQENSIYQLASEINGLLVGTITIASYFSIASHWLPGLIKEFQELYPKVEIQIIEGVRNEVLELIDDRIADVGFTSFREPMPYDWIPLYDDPMLALLSKDHPLAKEKAFPIERCNEEDFIVPVMGRDEDILALFEENHLSPHIRFKTKENFSVISMIEQGLGMGIMNELITKGWETDVVKLPLNPPQFLTLGIVIPSLEHASPAVKRFIRFAVRQLTKQRYVGDGG